MSVYGLIIGALSALMGIGGGQIANLFMTFHGRSIHQAIATSSGLGALIAVPATLGYIYAGWPRAAEFPDVTALQFPFALGYVSLIGTLLVVPTSTLVAPLGARLAHRLTKRQLEVGFGLFSAGGEREVFGEFGVGVSRPATVESAPDFASLIRATALRTSHRLQRTEESDDALQLAVAEFGDVDAFRQRRCRSAAPASSRSGRSDCAGRSPRCGRSSRLETAGAWRRYARPGSAGLPHAPSDRCRSRAPPTRPATFRARRAGSSSPQAAQY